jgi:precorrin-4 methylase
VNVVGTHVQDIGPSSTIPYTDTTLTKQFISDGVSRTITIDNGVALSPSFTNLNSLFEVFVGGQNDLVRLKKSDYTVYDVNQYGEPSKTVDSIQYLENGNVVYPQDYTVTSVTSQRAEIELRKTVPQGTQITVVTRTGITWDGDKSGNPKNIIDELGNIGSFVKVSEGLWYSDYKN